MFFLFQTINLFYYLCDTIKVNYQNSIKNLEPFMVNLSFYLINTISKLQIYAVKQKKEFLKIIDRNPVLFNFKNNIMLLFKTKIKNVELVKDGTAYTEVIDSYDFIIYSDNSIKKNTIDKNLVNKIIVDNKNNIPIKYDISNISFILLDLKIREKTYIIRLRNEVYNFYVVGNIFDLNFCKYYVKTILKENFDFSNDDKIVLNILDQNVNNNRVELYPKNQSILLEKNSYAILN